MADAINPGKGGIMPLTGPEFAQLCARKGALKLEILGMRHSSGKSVYALCKREYGLRGTRASVLEQMQAMVNEAIVNRHAAMRVAISVPIETDDDQLARFADEGGH